MAKKFRMLGMVALVCVVVVGLSLVMTSGDALAKGKPQPPPCPCPETIELPGGIVCVLESCGSDCVYTCPLPF
jgi:hypothetical protein